MTAFTAANTATRVAHDIDMLSDGAFTGRESGVSPFALPHAPLSMPRQQLEPDSQASRRLFGALFLGVRQVALGHARSDR
jgi:hypothetical protein